MLTSVRLLICVCIATTWGFFVCGCNALAEDVDLASAAATGWNANMNAIGDDYVCTFRVDSLIDEGGVISRQFIQDGVYACLGDSCRYSIQCRDRGPKSFCWNEVRLFQGNLEMVYSPLMKVVNLNEGRSLDDVAIYSPLTMGLMGPGMNRSFGAFIRRASKDAKLKIEVEQSSKDGLMSFRLISPEVSTDGVAWRSDMEWVMSPEHGFMPAVVTVRDSPDLWASVTTVKEFRKVGKAFWPWISETETNPGSVGYSRIIRFTTLEVSFDKKRIREFLEFPVAAGTRMVNAKNMRSVFPVRKDSISPKDAPSFLLDAEAALRNADERTKAFRTDK